MTYRSCYSPTSRHNRRIEQRAMMGWQAVFFYRCGLSYKHISRLVGGLSDKTIGRMLNEWGEPKRRRPDRRGAVRRGSR